MERGQALVGERVIRPERPPTTTPLVSALVPTCNAERFMRPLLEDLEAQTIRDHLEIIIVDTGSPGRELAIAREFQAIYQNVVYVRTEQRENAHVAVNRAADLARGTYVTPAATDDRHRPDAFARLIAALEARPDVALAYADFAVTHTENETLERAHVVGHFRLPEFDPRHLFQICYVGCQPLYRRVLHERYGGFDPEMVVAGDYDFWCRLVAAGERFVHVPEVLGLYYLNPNGNEYSKRELCFAESERARLRNWPSSWGHRPALATHTYLVPCVPPAADAGAAGAPAPPPARADAAPAAPLTAEAAAGPAAALPLVSVIIPTRDRPAGLARAVRSVLAQTYERIELLVVNDGGADVGADLAALDQRRQITSVRHPASRERSAARNTGLRLARGTYVAYLDDDDWYEPTHIETLVAILEDSGEDVAYADARRVHERVDGGRYVAEGERALALPDFDRDELLIGNFIPINCVLHRRSCLDGLGGFDESLATHEDWDLWLRLSRGRTFLHVPRTTCAISWREDGSSTTSRCGADFARTAELIHRRYAAEVAGRPALAAKQVAYRAAMAARWSDTAPAAPAADTFVSSIVLVLSGDAARARQCLARLARVTGAAASYELIVVDDGADPATAQVLARLAGDVRRLRREPGEDLWTACNRAGAIARGDHLVFLTDALVPQEGWLEALLGEVGRDRAVHVVGSRLMRPDALLVHAGFTLPRGGIGPVPRHRGRSAWDSEVTVRAELRAVAAAGMLVRRETFLGLDGFDAPGAGALADVDLCLRARRAGGRVVYQPASALFVVADEPVPPAAEADGARLHARWGHEWDDAEADAAPRPDDPPRAGATPSRVAAAQTAGG